MRARTTHEEENAECCPAEANDDAYDSEQDDDELGQRQERRSLVHLDHDRLRHRLRDVRLGGHLARVCVAGRVGSLWRPTGGGTPAGVKPGGCGGRLPGGWGGSAATLLSSSVRPSRPASRWPDSRLCGPRMCSRSCRASLASADRRRPR